MKLPAFQLRFALLVPVLVLLSACAAFASAPASQLSLAQQDSGKTYAVHVGDTVKVDLLDAFPVPGSSTVWNADTSNPAVLSRVSTSRETPTSIAHSQAHYLAIFRALKAGTATIQMTGTARCEAMNQAFCPQPHGTITITVS